MSAWGTYVHVPFCRIRCPYCAFHVDPDHSADHAGFVDAVIAEHRLRRPQFSGAPLTVYLGGGTPSRLPVPQLARLLDALDTRAAREVTLEANPEDVDAAWIAAVQRAGVNRVSLGVQTLSPRHARALGRARTPDDARAAVAALKVTQLPTWSVDLMFGLHDQTTDELEADIDAILALDPPHVSLYGLTIEEGTGYARAHERGRLAPADDDRWHTMYGTLVARLKAAGLHRYEVSNFAREGHRSQHNAGYWQARPYLGLGPSAHGLAPDGTRWANVSDTRAWQQDPVGTALVEHPEPADVAVERLLSGMRTVEGVDLAKLAQDTGLVPPEPERRRLANGGLLVDDAQGMRLTDDGFYVADAVVRALVHALAPVDPVALTR